MANDVLAKLSVQIDANTQKFGAALNTLNGQINKFGTNIKAQNTGISSFQSSLNKLQSAFGALGLALGVQQIASFALEISKLSGEAEGVRDAFNKLPQSIQLMQDLKDATGGTVSELELMKRAVQASNFNISLKALPDLLEFAAVRAQQTGQSVDYLVDSIVTGIGRKSPLILDNLGISATALREEMNGVSLATADVGQVAEAVGRIAGRSLEQMGELGDNTNTKIQRLGATWKNLKVAIGDAANGSGAFGLVVDSLSEGMRLLASDATTFFDKLSAIAGIQFSGGLSLLNLIQKDATKSSEALKKEQKEQEQVVREVDRAYAEFNGNIEAYGKAIETHVLRIKLLAEFQRRLNEETKVQATEIENITNLTAKLNILQKERDDLTGDSLAKANVEIQVIQKKIKALQELGTAYKIPITPVEIPITFGDLSLDSGSLDAGLQKFIEENKPPEFIIPVSVDIDPENTDQVDTFVDNIKDRMESLQQAISSTLRDGIGSTIAAFAEDLGNAAAGVGNFGDNILKALSSFAKQFGSLLIAVGIARINFDKIKFAGSGIGLVAAGAALIAAASAVSSHLSKSASAAVGGGGSGAQSATPVNYSNAETRIVVEGVLIGDGDKLKAVIQNANVRDYRTRG